MLALLNFSCSRFFEKFGQDFFQKLADGGRMTDQNLSMKEDCSSYDDDNRDNRILIKCNAA